MKTYFVTGAMGFIGSHFSEMLLKKGANVIGLDLGPSAPHLLEYKNFTFVQDTIKNTDILKRCVDLSDYVCHIAGIAEPDQYVKTPRKVIDITAIAGIELIEMCRLTGKLFFLTSTSEIYGNNPNVPFKETDSRILGPTSTNRWCYSSSKALLEHYLMACAHSKELNSVIVRLFNVYGPRLKGRVVANYLENALEGKDLIVHGDGAQTRSFTYVTDVIDAFDRLIHSEKCQNQIFNVGNPVETSILDFAKAVQKISDKPIDLQYMTHAEYYGKSYEDIDRRVPDVTKLSEYTGWTPTTSLEDGLKMTFEYMKAQYDN